MTRHLKMYHLDRRRLIAKPRGPKDVIAFSFCAFILLPLVASSRADDERHRFRFFRASPNGISSSFPAAFLDLMAGLE
jgi:hypothetical protein